AVWVMYLLGLNVGSLGYTGVAFDGRVDFLGEFFGRVGADGGAQLLCAVLEVGVGGRLLNGLVHLGDDRVGGAGGGYDAEPATGAHFGKAQFRVGGHLGQQVGALCTQHRQRAQTAFQQVRQGGRQVVGNGVNLAGQGVVQCRACTAIRHVQQLDARQHHEV